MSNYKPYSNRKLIEDYMIGFKSTFVNTPIGCSEEEFFKAYAKRDFIEGYNLSDITQEIAITMLKDNKYWGVK